MSGTFSSALVIGAEVWNREGKKIAKIEDLLVDIESGHVIYAIVSFNEFNNEVGADDRYYPVPFEAIKKDSDSDRIKPAVSKERLQNAPNFEKNNWRGEYDEKLAQQVYSYYGYQTPSR
ncbi:MAG TPA: PRC-barrel domain-containing protein [Balneolaceae bacterium]